jgi:fucose 4-O-acetylase-like acetyltransferase
MAGALTPAGDATARDPSLDVARGIAIVLVVFGHNRALSVAWPDFIAAIFLFHVPVFFLLSGRVLRTQPPSSAARGLARRLLLPFAVAALLVGAAKCIMRGESPGETLAGLAWATGQTLPWSHLWFLPALFLALLATHALSMALRANAERWAGAVMLVAAAAWALSVTGGAGQTELLAGAHFPRPVGLPWSLDLLPLCLTFVLLGQWLRVSETVRRVSLHPVTVLICVAVFAASLGAAQVDLNMRVFSPFGVALAAAAAGCVLTLKLSQWLCRIEPVARPLTLVGRHTLAIFLLHVSLQKVLLGLLPLDALPAIARAAVGIATAVSAIMLSLLVSLIFDQLRLRHGLSHARTARWEAR